ncbi:hypothetical protein M3210_12670 [Oceanobacillus luteolus]|uniref:Uncharacterized protein n=1 Tax=Oceanobacillus luteolus TaxID=1274358 RepID=A0ABW4HTY6_9BACI|nr:hypothetical protein [Oceanobacillus luteolus]MCM3741124.1 hypothetical protein [Oceanobacillus luteolus]
MGYIMPVDRFQYIQYQERIRPEKISTSPVNPSFKVVLEKEYEQISSEYERLLPSSYKNIPLKPQTQKLTDYTFAKMTGIGRNFNETI